MAALPLHHHHPCSHSPPLPGYGDRRKPGPVVISCMNRRLEEERGKTGEGKEESKGLGPRPGVDLYLTSLQKLGEGLRGNLSPQRKGDWKDLTLMSLSFAVYIYISQKLVCAYYAWISIPTSRW